MVTALVIGLIAIGVLALATVPVLIRSARARQVAAPVGRQPAMGSPAQVWVSRGERVLRELTATHGGRPGFATLASDAELVVVELRVTASQVAELADGLSRIPVPALEDERAALTERLSTATDTTDLTRSLEAVAARLAAAARQRATRDALVAKMQATVLELERARDELAEAITGTTSALTPNQDATAALTGRLDGLREGLVEVRRASHPDIGPAGQGHP